MAATSSRRWWIITVLAALALIAGFVVYRQWRQPGGDNEAAEITDPQELARLVELKDRAVALAENARYLEADALFEQLAQKLPSEPLVLRNLTVVRVGQFERQQDGGDAKAQEESLTPEKLVEAVAALLKAEPNEAASHILASRAAVQLKRLAPELLNQLPDPLKSLEKAAELAPENAAVRYELVKLVQGPDYNDDPKALQAQFKALKEAHRLEPRNLTLLWALLQRQSNPQSPDPKFQDTLAESRPVMAPLREIVFRLQGGASVDVEAILDKVEKAAAEQDWKTANRSLTPLVNVARSSWPHRTDIKRVEVGALEYLRYEFSGPIAKRLPKTTLDSAPDTKVRFVSAAALPQDLRDIRDLRLADVDLNGRLDLVVLHGDRLTILSRPRAGDDWTALMEVEVAADMRQVLVADLDRDAANLPAGVATKVDRVRGNKAPGDEKVTDTLVELDSCDQAFPDFLLYGPEGICAVRNERAGMKETASPTGGLARKLTLQSITPELAKIGNVTAAILVDFDHDQDLDVVAGVEGQGVRLWRMLGNGTFRFADYTRWSTLPEIHGRITDLSLVDWDRDLYTDVFVCVAGAANDGGESQPQMPILLHNQRHGQLLGRELDKEFEALRGSTSLVPTELDGNVSWDLAGLADAELTAVLTATPEPGKVNARKSLPPAPAKGDRLAAWDFDNDTFPDLLTWDERSLTILRGTSDGWVPLDRAKVEVDMETGLRAVDYGDVDDDGDLDLVLAWPDRLQILDNDGGNAHNWLRFYVTGDYDGHQDVGANNSAIGTIVEVQTPGRYQAQVITRQPVHIGLGSAAAADRVRLLFTNGIPRSAQNAKANTLFCEKQVLNTSCPFVYCWDGDKYEFFTDCLWAAPIGLQVAEGQMAPSRAWEYLLIPGERLKERAGGYDLQLTEELWEAAYFDEVKLIAVDHPADTDIYTNEKVGGPDIAAPKLHLVKAPRRPIAARDKHGRDVLAQVSVRDEDYLAAYEGHITRGLVDEHFVELDLGSLVAPQRITLFLTGWIYPTNTSLNVNLSQHPDLEYPRLPYLQVSDGNGGWREVQAFMGFPGGKTKTIAVEVPGEVFASGDNRLRICTSAEIYWDDVFFTVNEQPVVGQDSERARQHTMLPVSADLHYRGFSAELPRHPHAPQRFLYSRVSTEAKWPPMHGNFTRYGDVRPLLTNADDQMVVMGSGDEMTIRFPAPAEGPPPGWKRDFILYSVGWDKDADLNTVYGQTAEPLPYNAMPSYPYPTEPGFPDSAEHRTYLETYQTRQQDHRRFWRQLVE